MRLDVSPTRMELLRLKKRRAIAVRGHKLLKDKLDEFVRQLLALVKEVAGMRKNIDSMLRESREYLSLAGAATFPESVTAALSASEKTKFITVTMKQILNIRVPEYAVNEAAGAGRGYGFAQTSVGIDTSLEKFEDASREIIRLAEKEKAIQMIAEEIQKTRRRVNALEYILIPNLEETIQFISMKLEEHERNTKTQLMRIKDVVRAPKAQTSAYPGRGKFPL